MGEFDLRQTGYAFNASVMLKRTKSTAYVKHTKPNTSNLIWYKRENINNHNGKVVVYDPHNSNIHHSILRSMVNW